MDTKSQIKPTVTTTSNKPAKSFAIAAEGIKTSREFTSLMSAMMSDLISGSISPNVSNAVCNAGGKMLKAVELEYKFGKSNGSNQRVLQLTSRT